MADLPVYQFPTATSGGLLLGLSLSRLAAIGAAGVVFVAVAAIQTAPAVTVGGTVIVGLLAATFVPVAGRPAIDWLPVWVSYGWAAATGNNQFYTNPDVALDLPDGVLDLPGELFGLELHSLHVESTATVGSAVGYGVVVDTFRRRLVAIAELSGDDFLFGEAAEMQARVTGWGTTLDHVAQSLPEICRLQVVHVAGPPSSTAARRWHHQHATNSNRQVAGSYRQVLDAAAEAGQQHRLLLAIALDGRAARRAVRQAGGGLDGAAAVLMDRAATIENALTGTGVQLHGWLGAAAVARLLRAGFDPTSTPPEPTATVDGTDEVAVATAACGPSAMVDGWAALRHDSGWSATLQVVAPPSRPVTGDFLQHLLIGVPAGRRMSLLYVPTEAAVAERRAQSRQVSTEAETQLRARWGFAGTARQAREHADAAVREQQLVEGRAVFRLVWLITVTVTDPAGLETAVATVEAAARRCGLGLRRLVGMQRQAAGWTLPLCRGAR